MPESVHEFLAFSFSFTINSSSLGEPAELHQNNQDIRAHYQFQEQTPLSKYHVSQPESET